MRHMARQNNKHTHCTRRCLNNKTKRNQQHFCWTVYFEILRHKNKLTEKKHKFQKKKREKMNSGDNRTTKTQVGHNVLMLFFCVCWQKYKKSVENEKTNKTINVRWKGIKRRTKESREKQQNASKREREKEWNRHLCMCVCTNICWMCPNIVYNRPFRT